MLVGTPEPGLGTTNSVACLTVIEKGKAMILEAGEPECLERQPTNLPSIVRAVSGANATAVVPREVRASADDAPGRRAIKALAHARIHLAVTGAATAGHGLFVTATQTSAGALGAIDRANSIAVN